MSSIELKDAYGFVCPFCGGEVVVGTTQEGNPAGVHKMERDCAAFMDKELLDYLVMVRRAYGIVASWEMN